MTGTCPAGCGRNERPGMFLCTPCWREVPRHLQMDVNRTWAKVKVRHTLSREDRREVIAAYRQARSAALAAIA